MARILTIGAAIQRAIEASNAAAASATTSGLKAAESAASAATSMNGAANSAANAAQAALAKADAEATAEAIRVLLARGPGNVYSNYFPVATAPLPIVVLSAVAVTLGDKVYAVGGISSNNTLNSNLIVYKTQTNNFATLSVPELSRKYHGVAALSSTRFLVCGGQNSEGQNLASVLAIEEDLPYYAASLASMPGWRFAHSATQLSNNRVLVCGGQVDSGITNTALIYDGVADAWTATEPMPMALHYHSATTLTSGKVLVCGGIKPDGIYSNKAFLFDPDGPINGKWTNAATLISTFVHPGWGEVSKGGVAFLTLTALPNGTALMCGGGYAGENFAHCYVYRENLDSWIKSADLPVALYSHMAAPIAGNRVFIAGGYSSNEGVTDKSYILNPTLLF